MLWPEKVLSCQLWWTEALHSQKVKSRQSCKLCKCSSCCQHDEHTVPEQRLETYWFKAYKEIPVRSLSYLRRDLSGYIWQRLETLQNSEVTKQRNSRREENLIWHILFKISEFHQKKLYDILKTKDMALHILNRHLPHDCQRLIMASKHMKKMLTSLDIIREIKIKTTIRYHFTSTTWL